MFSETMSLKNSLLVQCCNHRDAKRLQYPSGIKITQIKKEITMKTFKKNLAGGTRRGRQNAKGPLEVCD